jgi:hypothetical protein
MEIIKVVVHSQSPAAATAKTLKWISKRVFFTVQHTNRAGRSIG